MTRITLSPHSPCVHKLQFVDEGATIDRLPRMVLRVVGKRSDGSIHLLRRKDGSEFYFVDITNFLYQSENTAKTERTLQALLLTVLLIALPLSILALMDGSFSLPLWTAVCLACIPFASDKGWKKHQQELQTLFTEGKVVVETHKLRSMLKTLSKYTSTSINHQVNTAILTG